LFEAHAADERSNSYSALPNRPAKVRLGMEYRGYISSRVTSNWIESILPNAAHVQGSTRAIVAAFPTGEGVALNKNHTRLHIRKMLLTCGNWSTDVQSGAKVRTAFI